MSLTTRFGLVAGTTALAIAGTAFGGAESDNDALSQIAELKRELAELKQQDSQDWLTEQRASEIRGIVQDVLADADTRTSFQNSGAMAGWNNGFFLASPDGNFKLNVSGLMQVRWTWNNAKGQNDSNPPAQAGDENLWGFENGNTYLDFSGNVVDPSWTYHIRMNASDINTGGAFGISFASVTKDFGNGWGVTVGQFRGPWLRETLVDDGYQLGVNRSIMNSFFTQGFDQGMQLNYESDAFRFNAFYGDGVLSGTQFNGLNIGGSQNTPWNGTNTRFSVAGRGEYKLSGDWSTFDDFTSFRGEEGGMMVGVAGVYEIGNQNSAFENDAVYGFTADFSWEMGGANLFAAFAWLGNNIDNSNNPWGLNVQGGYFVTDDVEIFGRYDYLDYDVQGGGGAGDTSKYNGITVGANYFWTSNVKATVEWGINLKSFGATSSPFNEGFRPDIPGESDQWNLRAQLQLMF